MRTKTPRNPVSNIHDHLKVKNEYPKKRLAVSIPNRYQPQQAVNGMPNIGGTILTPTSVACQYVETEQKTKISCPSIIGNCIGCIITSN